MKYFRCSKCFAQYTVDEFIHLNHVPDPRFKGGNCSVCKCGNIFGIQKWHISTVVENYTVSTIDLESPACGNILSLDKIMEDHGKQFWYETMILSNDTDEILPFQARYETKSEAEKGHELAVKNINKIILDQRKYPRSIFAQFSDMIK